MKKLLGNVLLVFLAVCLAGCYSTGRKIDQAAVDTIKKGETTRAQVINMLGSPEAITRTGSGDTVYIYNYIRSTAKPATFIPYIGPFVGGANIQHQMTSVTFGPDGVVKDFSSTQGSTESGMGLAAGGKAETPEVEEGKRAK